MGNEDFLVFNDDDDSYLRWVKKHLNGFVVNTPRSPNPDYMVLHKAVCHSITEYSTIAKPGGFTERDYIKVCAVDVDSLKTWAREHGRYDGRFSSECQICKPLRIVNEYDDWDW